jgi:signal transduction histidine kinase
MIGVAVHSAHARGFANHVLLEASAQGHAIHTFEKRLSALFDQAGGPSRSMTYIHDLKRQRIRYVDGGLASQIGLSGGALPYSEWLARIHPEEQNSLAAYHLARTGLSDDEFITSTVRVRDSKDEWRLINLRARVLRRDPDGAPRLLVGRAMDISDYADAAVQAAGVTMLRAEENERARIGRELHDSTSQYLIAADLGLARVLRNEGLSDDDRARLRDVQESLATVQTEMRALTFFLHPPEVGELGLVRTIERFCAGFARRSGLEIPFVSDSAPKDLPGDAEHALFRVCQEALMNVYRHAFARRVTVSLTVKDAQVTLEVRDDGIGVDSAERFQQGGIGVAGMRKRMQNVGGELVLDYSGPGLAVVARVPLPAGDVA